MFGLILFAGLLYLWPGFVRYLEEIEEPPSDEMQLFLFKCFLGRCKDERATNPFDRARIYDEVYGVNQ